jgi:cysteine desulfurase
VLGLLLGRSRSSRRLVHSAVEHSSVFKAAEWWGRVHGGTADSVGVDPLGRISLEQLSDVLVAEPAGVLAVQSANLEVGTVQPRSTIAASPRGLSGCL